jgi:hypothetical protein
MKIICLYALLVAALLVGGCASGESYFRIGYNFDEVDKVAVVDVLGDVTGEASKNQIADFFVMELLKKGYAPVERAHVQSILKEQELQMSEITTSEGVAKAGEILNVPTIVVINIPNLGEEMSITAKMIDVEDGSVLWMASGSGKTGRTLLTIGGAAAGAAAGAGVSGADDQVLGGIAGGVLGGIAGQGLSAQKAEQVRKVVKKMCKSLPLRIGGM